MRALSVLALLVPLAVVAQPSELPLLGGAAAPQARLDEVSADLRQSFERALARYDADIAAEPFRVPTRIARCRFIASFQLDYEYVGWIDEVYAHGEECETALAPFAEHPEVRLWRLENIYGDEERLAAAQGLLTEFDVHGWTSGQRARLYTELATVSERLDEGQRFRERTAEYARQALVNDLRADVRLPLAAYFQWTGDKAAALEALTSPFDGHDPQDNWYIARKMTFLAELGERDAVLALQARLAGNSSYYDRTEAAEALRLVGEFELARAELSSDSLYGPAAARQQFVLALASGDPQDAHAAYERLRDVGWKEDPIGANRVALFVAHPSLPWRARDALGMLGALAYLAALLALWSVPLCLVHYRGLANRLRSAVSAPHSGLGLRHAFLGLSAFTLASLLSLYAVGPIHLFDDQQQPWVVVAEQRQLATMLVADSVLGMGLLAAVAFVLRRHFTPWLSTHWSIGKSILIAAGVAVVFRLPLFVMILSGYDESVVLRFDSGISQILLEIDEVYGAAAMLMVVALAAPLVEEFVFRGLLLRAFVQHLSFPVANCIQAALFAALHLDLAATPYLFGVGLMAGWLARRSGGLLAPIVLHAIFNLIAGLLIMS